MNIVCIGSGNVATHLVMALQAAGHTITQVVSRTEAGAERLARMGNTCWTNRPEQIQKADLYLYAVSDIALAEVIAQNPQADGLHVHTAGSMPLALFEGIKKRGGVLYPLQTFSREKPVDFSQIPLFVEAFDANDTTLLKTIASSISKNVFEASSEQRQQLHLAAVFACNFTNHLYAIADALLKEANLPFEVLRPLMQETLDKTATLAPNCAQTGPAVRKDTNVMEKQIAKLSAHPQWQEIYRMLSQSIQEQ